MTWDRWTIRIPKGVGSARDLRSCEDVIYLYGRERDDYVDYTRHLSRSLFTECLFFSRIARLEGLLSPGEFPCDLSMMGKPLCVNGVVCLMLCLFLMGSSSVQSQKIDISLIDQYC